MEQVDHPLAIELQSGSDTSQVEVGVPVWAGINKDGVVGPVWAEDGLKLNSRNLLPTSLSFDVKIRVSKPD